MFAVDHVLVSDAVLDAPFVCPLGACKGACCVVGEGGAPLDEAEKNDLERAYAEVRADLRPEAVAQVDAHGLWTDEPEGLAVATLENDEGESGACVFVLYEGPEDRPVAVCAIQKAHQAGRLDWPKPLSCHLYPIRVENVAGNHLLNYEQIELCAPAIPHGQRLGVTLPDFLQGPLTRAYGADWYARFREAAAARLQTLKGATARLRLLISTPRAKSGSLPADTHVSPGPPC